MPCVRLRVVNESEVRETRHCLVSHLFKRGVSVTVTSGRQKGYASIAYRSYTRLVEFKLRCLKQYWETKNFLKS